MESGISALIKGLQSAPRSSHPVRSRREAPSVSPEQVLIRQLVYRSLDLGPAACRAVGSKPCCSSAPVCGACEAAHRGKDRNTHHPSGRNVDPEKGSPSLPGGGAGARGAQGTVCPGTATEARPQRPGRRTQGGRLGKAAESGDFCRSICLERFGECVARWRSHHRWPQHPSVLGSRPCRRAQRGQTRSIKPGAPCSAGRRDQVGQRSPHAASPSGALIGKQ